MTCDSCHRAGVPIDLVFHPSLEGGQYLCRRCQKKPLCPWCKKRKPSLTLFPKLPSDKTPPKPTDKACSTCFRRIMR